MPSVCSYCHQLHQLNVGKKSMEKSRAVPPFSLYIQSSITINCLPSLLPSFLLPQRRRHVPLPAAPQHLALRAERGRRHPVSGGGAGARAGFGGLARPRARGSPLSRGREGGEPGLLPSSALPSPSLLSPLSLPCLPFCSAPRDAARSPPLHADPFPNSVQKEQSWAATK